MRDHEKTHIDKFLKDNIESGHLKLFSANGETLQHLDIDTLSRATSIFYRGLSTDFSWIWYFYNVTDLTCINTTITSLAPLKSLKNLKYIKFVNNGLKDISELNDVLTLSSLICNYNPINSVVLFNTKSLQFLNLSYCDIDNLNISSLEYLAFICCRYNRISHLTLENLPSLHTFTGYYNHQRPKI